MAEEPASLPLEQPENPHIGASWVPVEEQTFEFQEEIAVAPATALTEDLPLSMAEEPISDLPAAAEPPTMVAPPTVAAGGEVALSDEQLRQALLSVSKETIERIVWEVVPDLAEAMIKETIRRITEGR